MSTEYDRHPFEPGCFCKGCMVLTTDTIPSHLRRYGAYWIDKAMKMREDIAALSQQLNEAERLAESYFSWADEEQENLR